MTDAKGRMPGGWYTGDDGETHHSLTPPAAGWWLGPDAVWRPPRPAKEQSAFMRWLEELSHLQQAILVVVVLAIVLGIGAIGALQQDGTKPISEQSCVELAATFREINRKIEANGDDVGQAMQDATELNARVDELGGCPGETTLN